MIMFKPMNYPSISSIYRVTDRYHPERQLDDAGGLERHFKSGEPESQPLILLAISTFVC